MKRWLPILLLAIACAAEVKPPKDILDREVFKRLLMGSQLIEARTSQEMTLTERNTGAASAQYDELFASEHVTAQQYRKTFDWYAAHPELLKPIYEEILVDLQHAADTSAHAPARPADEPK
jgi:hypothetical protein